MVICRQLRRQKKLLEMMSMSVTTGAHKAVRIPVPTTLETLGRVETFHFISGLSFPIEHWILPLKVGFLQRCVFH